MNTEQVTNRLVDCRETSNPETINRCKNQLKTVSHFLLLVLFFSFTQVFSQDLQGWDINKGKNYISYIPSNLVKGKTFHLIVYAPVKLNKRNSKKMTISAAKSIQKVLGKPLKDWSIKSINNNGFNVTNMYKNAHGEKLFVSYTGVPIQHDDFYIVQVISSMDSNTQKFIKKMPVLFTNARQRYRPNQVNKHSDKTAKTTKEKRNKYYSKERNIKYKKIEKSVHTVPGKGAKLSGIETIWSDIYFNSAVGSIVVTPYILFKDRSAYTRLTIPPTELDVEKSKRLQVAGDVYKRGKWTKWRRRGAHYEIISLRTGKWKKLEGSKAISGKKGETVNFKYSAGGGNQARGSWKNKFILKADGTFEMDTFRMMNNEAMGGGDVVPLVTTVSRSNKNSSKTNTSVIGDNIGGGISSKRNNGSKNTGTYSFGDYSIILRHDNGWVHSELFYFDKADKTSVVFRDKRYWTGR